MTAGRGTISQFFKSRNAVYSLLLFLLWGFVQSSILIYGGIKTDQEAARIILQAENLVKTGSFITQTYFLYLTEIILVAAKIKLHAGFGLIVTVHLVLNLIALHFFYTFLKQYLASQKLAFWGSVLLVICYPYQQYNSYIYSESVFFSISVIYSCFLLGVKKFNFPVIILLLALLLLLCITRPTGIFFLGATAVFIYFKLNNILKPVLKIAVPVTALIIAVAAVDFFIRGNSGFDVIVPFEEEHVICGVTTLDITPATVMAVDNSLAKLGGYLINHKWQFGRLALLRSKAFWGLTREYYSFFHNSYLLLFFYPLYFFAVGAVIRTGKKMNAETGYLLSVCLIYWLSVIFTCDDWGNRFFFTLPPFLICIALSFFKKRQPG